MFIRKAVLVGIVMILLASFVLGDVPGGTIDIVVTDYGLDVNDNAYITVDGENYDLTDLESFYYDDKKYTVSTNPGTGEIFVTLPSAGTMEVTEQNYDADGPYFVIGGIKYHLTDAQAIITNDGEIIDAESYSYEEEPSTPSEQNLQGANEPPVAPSQDFSIRDFGEDDGGAYVQIEGEDGTEKVYLDEIESFESNGVPCQYDGSGTLTIGDKEYPVQSQGADEGGAYIEIKDGEETVKIYVAGNTDDVVLRDGRSFGSSKYEPKPFNKLFVGWEPGSIFSPSGLDGYMNFFNRLGWTIGGEERQMKWMAWYEDLMTRSVIGFLLGDAKQRAFSFCYHIWLSKDQREQYIGLGSRGSAYFSIQGEYLTINDVLTKKKYYIYKVPWIVTLPSGDGKWKWTVYFKCGDLDGDNYARCKTSEGDLNPGDPVPLYLNDNDGEKVPWFRVSFGSGSLDFRGEDMWINPDRNGDGERDLIENEYTHVCIRFYDDGDASWPWLHIPTMTSDQNPYCVRLGKSEEYKLDVSDFATEEQDYFWIFPTGGGGGGGGSGGGGGGDGDVGGGGSDINTDV